MITIVIPSYNAANYIEATLQSVCAQTYSDWEVLVVDDGSTDSTCDIIMRYIEKDTRFQLLRLEHEGAPGHCRNAGLHQAKGEYILFLDSDDLLYPTMLAQMLTAMQAAQADVVICQPRYVNQLTAQEMDNEQGWFFEAKEHTLSDLFQINPFPCNKLYRTQFLRDTKVLYLCGVFNQDLGFFLSNLCFQPKFAILHDILMEYTVRPNSITTNPKTRKRHIDILTVFDQVFATWKACDEEQSYAYGLMRMFIRTMLFKVQFFDLQKDRTDIMNIRSYLYAHCPAWYKHPAFLDHYTRKKQMYNRMLMQYELYDIMAWYKARKKQG